MLTRICLILLTGALAAEAVTYSYDSAGRLAKADYGAAGAIVYVYDNAGNLLNLLLGLLPTARADLLRRLVDTVAFAALAALPPLTLHTQLSVWRETLETRLPAWYFKFFMPGVIDPFISNVFI